MPPATNDVQMISGRFEENLLDDLVQSGTDNGSWQERQQYRKHELLGARIARQAPHNRPKLGGIDGQQSQNCAELDQHFESPAGGRHAEDFFSQKQMGGRRHRQIFCQALNEPKQDCVPRFHAKNSLIGTPAAVP